MEAGARCACQGPRQHDRSRVVGLRGLGAPAVGHSRHSVCTHCECGAARRGAGERRHADAVCARRASPDRMECGRASFPALGKAHVEQSRALSASRHRLLEDLPRLCVRRPLPRATPPCLCVSLSNHGNRVRPGRRRQSVRGSLRQELGIDVIIALSINELKGGHHVMLSFDGQHAIVVETSPDGTLIIGTHAARAHGFTCARATTERGVLSPRAQAITRRCCTATWRRTTAAASSPHST